MNTHYPYLIIGGGMAADAAARGIRKVDPERAIGLVGLEPDPPYNRPPLSKGLWKRGPRPMPLSRIFRQTGSLGVDLLLGRKAIHLDPAAKQVRDDRGDTFSYDRLLIATGGDPVRLGPPDAPASQSERVIYYRTLADYHRLRALTETGQRFAVIGGGFVGSEIAAVLAAQGKEVTMIFPEAGIGARALPPHTSAFLNHYYREQGVRVLNGDLVHALQPEEGGVSLQTGQETLHVDGVVAGLGIRPNVALAQSAGLAIENGIRVNEYLQTSQPDIYAAGDVANFFSPTLGKRMRAEHEENANLSGHLAGQAMAGARERYETLPSVYSTLFDLTYDAVGELDPALEILYDWQEPMQKGVAYYLKQGQVRGVLLWNLARGLDIARELIAARGPFRKEDLIGRIRA